jgi:hypothetical protein
MRQTFVLISRGRSHSSSIVTVLHSPRSLNSQSARAHIPFRNSVALHFFTPFSQRWLKAVFPLIAPFEYFQRLLYPMQLKNQYLLLLFSVLN